MRKFIKKVLSVALASLLVTGCIAPVSAAEGGYNSNIEFTPINGTWTKTEDGLVATGSGDCYAMSKVKVKDFIFEADVVIESGNAASLVFGSKYDNPNTGRFCLVANVDIGSRANARIFKFNGGDVSDVGIYALPDVSVNEYHMRVEFIDGQMSYFLNGVLAVSGVEVDFTEGYLGLMIASSTTVYNNVNYYVVDENTPRIKEMEIEGAKFDADSPEFDENIFSYTATALYETESIKITTSAGEGVECTVSAFSDDGAFLGTYPASEVPLKEGINKLIINPVKGDQQGLSTLLTVLREFNPDTLYTEEYRPQYHVTPEYGWLNDPNGPIYYNGEWHIFYQYNPHKIPEPENQKYWAHVASKDFVHWEQRPLALAPDMYGSMWSGSIVVDENNCSGLFDDAPNQEGLIAYYTVTPLPSTRPQQQSMAYSVDGGNTWTKYNGGEPIITTADDPAQDGNFRDPKIFWHEESNQWMMIVAGGPIRFFSSTDLLHWKAEGFNKSIGTECPDFFKLPVDGDENNEKWVLSCAGENYMIGEFKEVGGVWTFIPDTNNRYNIDSGAPDLYAAQSLYGDPQGRRILIYWMADLFMSKNLQKITDPWNGALSLPYEAKLVTNANGQVVMTLDPIDELDMLRGEPVAEIKDLKVDKDTINPLKDIQLNKFEMEAVIDMGDAQEFGMVLRAGNNQQTLVYYSTLTGALTIDRTNSGAYPSGSSFARSYSKAVQLTADKKLKLHMYVDNSSVEIFAQDGTTVHTTLIFPDETSSGMELYAKNGTVTIDSMTIYPMDSIYHEETAPESVDEIIVGSKTDELLKGDVLTVWANSDPIGYDFGDIEWSVSDKDVLNIVETGDSSLIVRAVGIGDCTITAKSGDLIGEFVVNVKAPEILTVYEAENALIGAGRVGDSTGGASGGKAVFDIMNNANSVIFTVNAQVTGKHSMEIFYLTLEDRNFEIIVNGEKQTVSCPGTNVDWDKKVASVMTEVELNEGENTIIFGNAAAPAPNLDCIKILEIAAPSQAEKVKDMINALPDEITLDDKADVEAAAKAFDALSDEEKASIPNAAKKLEDAQAKIKELEDAQDIPVDPPVTVIKGDLTNDGKVTVSDILALKTIIMSGETPTADQLAVADLNATPDGRLTVSDILGIKAIIMG